MTEGHDEDRETFLTNKKIVDDGIKTLMKYWPEDGLDKDALEASLKKLQDKLYAGLEEK